MPAYGNTSDTEQFQPPSIQLKTVALFFEAEAVPAIADLEAWITRFLATFHTAKERLKGFVQIGNDSLEDMTMNLLCLRESGFVAFDLAQLIVFADTATF